MASIILGEQREEVQDGEKIREACEELGVPFGCKKGVCGKCRIEVVEGASHLGELTDAEDEIGDCDETHRLACQATITDGTVTIKIDKGEDREDEDQGEDLLVVEEEDEENGDKQIKNKRTSTKV